MRHEATSQRYYICWLSARQTSIESVQDAGIPTQGRVGFGCLQTCLSDPRKAHFGMWSIPYLQNIVGSLLSDHSAGGLWTLPPSSQHNRINLGSLITKATLTSGSSSSHTYNISLCLFGPHGNTKQTHSRAGPIPRERLGTDGLTSTGSGMEDALGQCPGSGHV